MLNRGCRFRGARHDQSDIPGRPRAYGREGIGRLRLDLATHIWSVNFPALDTHNSGDLAARIGNNINELREHIVQSFSASFLGIFTLVGLTGYLFYLDVWLALIMLGAFAIIGLGLSLVNTFIKRIRERALIAFSDLSVELEDLSLVNVA